MKFHNGEPFDARSVKFTLERLSTPGDKAGGHVMFSSFGGIERVDTPDPLTVTSGPSVRIRCCPRDSPRPSGPR